MTWRDEDERYDFVRENAVEAATVRGRGIRTHPAPDAGRPCSVEFAQELRRCGASGALITRALGLSPPRRRRSVAGLIRRYGYTAFCTLCIGVGLVACAYVLIALSVMP